MKKIIAFLTVFVMTAVTAFADGAAEFSALMEKSSMLRSAQVSVQMSAQLNEPLRFIDSIPDIESDDIDINVRELVESLVGAQMDLSCTYSASEDFKKMTMACSVEYDVPITFSDSFKLNAWSKIGMWLDYDVSDAEKPEYKMILKIPFLKKYTVFDMSDMLEFKDGKIIDADAIAELSRKATDSLKENAEITGLNGDFTVKLDDNAAKRYILDIMDIAKEFIPDGTETDEFIENVEQLFDKVQIFGEDGITMELGVTPEGYIGTENVTIDICTNLYDILTAFSMSTEGLKREDAVIDLSFITSETISMHNRADVPAMPELTEENSDTINIAENNYNDYGKYYKKIAISPIFKDGTIYYPMEDIVLPYGFTIEDTNESITVKSPDLKNTVVFDESLGTLTVDGKDASEAYNVSMIYEGGKAYCNSEFLSALKIFTDSSLSYDIKNNTFNAYCSYYPPEEEEEEPEVEQEPEVYKEPKYLDYYVYSDRVPYMSGKTLCMPAYDFFAEMFEGSFSFDGDLMTYTADEEGNVFGIKTISVRPGDDFVTVDSRQIKLASPAAEIDGVIRIPVSFAEELGMTVDWINAWDVSLWRSGFGSCYSFSMKNPNYIEDHSDTDSYYDNWFYNLL